MRARLGGTLSFGLSFAASAAATFAAFGTLPACEGRCETQFDCGPQAYCDPEGRCVTDCFSDDDCRHPAECQGNALACAPKGLFCNSVGRCLGDPFPPSDIGPVIDPIPPLVITGWNDPPGSGEAFIVDALAIAGQGSGFDIDGACRGPGDCIDNALWRLGQLGNAQIRQGLIGGETLLLIELAGLHEPFADPQIITLKMYSARDADNPFSPANNFSTPTGEAGCCEFEIGAESTTGVPRQARTRSPIRLERGQLRSLAPVPIDFTLTVGSPPHHQIRIERSLLSGRLSSDLSRLSDGMIGGAVPVRTLARIDNPYCKTPNQLCQRQLPESTLIDLVSTLLQPDIDLDLPRDGLERLELGPAGRIRRCIDGDGETSVPPLRPGEPWTCALQPAIADGFSIGLSFSAVHATVVSVGQ